MKHCPICNNVFSNFLPLAADYYQVLNQVACEYSLDSYETLNCAQYSCPHCGASDRERMIALYLLGMNLLTPGTRILEIAPSRALMAFFAKTGVAYRSADLSSPLAQDKVDITDMHQYRRLHSMWCSARMSWNMFRTMARRCANCAACWPTMAPCSFWCRFLSN